MGFDVQKWFSEQETFQFFLSKGFNIMQHMNETDRNKLIQTIIKMNNLEFVKDLLRGGLDNTDHSLLVLAIESMDQDDTSIVRCLIDHGCPVNASKENMHSALLHTLQKNLPKTIRYLLHHGAKAGRLELKAIGKSLNIDMVDIFKKSGVDLNGEQAATLKGVLEIPKDNPNKIKASQQISMIKGLLEAGVSPYDGQGMHYTCGHIFVQNASHFSTKEKEALMDLLLNNGLDVNAVNGHIATMLHITPWTDIELLKILLDRGADPNIRNTMGRTPSLVKMSQLLQNNGDPEKFSTMVDLFVKHKADLNIKDNRNQNILNTLLSDKWVMYAKKLIRKVLSVAEMDLPTEPEVHRALGGMYKPCILVLLQAGCSHRELLYFLSINVTSYFDFDGLAACVDPAYRREKKGRNTPGPSRVARTSSAGPSRVVRTSSAGEGRGEVFYVRVHLLKDLAIYAIRKQILGANGNKSLIPRARKLPLQSSLIETVTLENYTLLDIDDDDDSDDDEEDINQYFDNNDSDFVANLLRFRMASDPMAFGRQHFGWKN